MPPKAKFTKEEIVGAALEIVREKGPEAVTTREIAAKLQISTRPIFTYFHTMEEVWAEIRLAAEARYEQYLEKGLQERIPFQGVGMQYLRFAREEPALYRLLFFDGGTQNGAIDEMHRTQALVRGSLKKTYHLDDAAADRYFRDMWLVVHSLATLIVTNSCPYSEAACAKILTGFSASLCKALKEIPGFAADAFDRDAVFRTLIPEETA